MDPTVIAILAIVAGVVTPIGIVGNLLLNWQTQKVAGRAAHDAAHAKELGIQNTEQLRVLTIQTNGQAQLLIDTSEKAARLVGIVEGIDRGISQEKAAQDAGRTALAIGPEAAMATGVAIVDAINHQTTQITGMIAAASAASMPNIAEETGALEQIRRRLGGK